MQRSSNNKTTPMTQAETVSWPTRLVAYSVVWLMLVQTSFVAAQSATLASSAGGSHTLVAPNNVPIVNIAKPNDKGVSHNQYQKFNIDKQGLILNNAKAPTATQLAGFINANPNLHNNPAATLIINEVIGANRSMLQGYAEIAGQQAGLVIANPYGISCNGCGFINTPRLTLSTGTPNFNNGDLTGFTVNGGSVVIQGLGLNANNVSQFDIISRSLELNANLYAQNLNIVLGRNNVNYANLSATARAAGGDTPLFALDSSAIGGMYANAIRLIGTEAGVGVRALGDVASHAGQLQLSVDGKIQLNQVYAKQLAQINSISAGIEINNEVRSDGDLSLSAAGQLSNNSLVTAANNITINSQTLEQQGTIAAAINGDYQIAGNGRLAITNSGQINNRGRLISGGATQLSFGSLANQNNGSIHSGASLSLFGNDISNVGALYAQGNVLAQLTGSLRNSGEIQTAANLMLTANSLNNSQGAISAAGQVFNLSLVGGLNNSAGLISTQAADSRISASHIINQQGRIEHGDNGSLTISSTAAGIDNRAGRIQSNSRLQLSQTESQTLDNSLGILAADQLSLEAGAIKNSSGVIEAQTLVIKAKSLVNDRHQGSEKIASISALSSAENGLVIELSGDLVNAAVLQSNTTSAVVKAKNIINSGDIIHLGKGRLQLSATQNSINSGLIIGTGELSLSQAELDNRQGKIISQKSALTGGGSSAANLTINSRAGLNNSAGIIRSEGGLQIKAASLNNQGGEITGLSTQQQSLQITAGLDNQQGVIQTNAVTFSLRAASLNNTQGKITHAGSGEWTLLLSNASGVLNNTQGQLQGNGRLIIRAGRSADNAGQTINNQQGLIVASHIDSKSASLDNRGGIIESQTLYLDIAGNLHNSSVIVNDKSKGGLIAALSSLVDSLQLKVSELIDNQGSLQSNAENLTLSAKTINNQGKIIHAGQGQLSLSASENLTNTGLIASAGKISISGNNLNNQGGQIVNSNNQSIQININGVLNNNAALIESAGAININAAGLTNNQGKISAIGQANSSISTSGDIVNGQGGLIQTNAVAFSLRAASLNNSQGKITHAGDGEWTLQLSNTSGVLNNQQGQLQSNGRLTIDAGRSGNNAGQAINNQQGLIVAAHIDSKSASLNNSGGVIESQTLYLDVAGDLRNGAVVVNGGDRKGGVISALSSLLNSLQLKVGELIDNQGSLQSNAENLELSAKTINNQGKIVHAGHGQLSLSASENLNNTGLITSAGKISISGNNLNNQGGQIVNSNNQSIQINVDGMLNNNAALIEAAGAININAAGLTNKQGKISAIGQVNSSISISGDLVNDQGGLIQSNAIDFSLSAASLDNSQGKIIHAGQGQLSLSASENLYNAGVISSAGKIYISGNNLNNQGGQIVNSNNQSIQININGVLNNNAALIESAGAININAAGLTNNQGKISAIGQANSSISTSGDIVNGQGGLIQTNAVAFNLRAASLNNSQGKITHAGEGEWTLQLSNTSGVLNNQQGQLQSNGRLTIDAGRSGNNAGQAINNQQGLIVATHIDSRSASLNNSGGVIESQTLYLDIAGDLRNGAVVVNGDDSKGGVISALSSLLNSLQLKVSELIDNQGSLQSNAENLELNAKTINNQGKIIHAGQGQLSLSASENFNNTGLITSAGKISVSGNNLNNQGGQIVNSNNQSITIDVAGLVNNTEALIESAGALNLKAAGLNNDKGKISALGEAASTITLSGDLNNGRGGLVQSNADIFTVTVRSLANQGGTILHAGEQQLLITSQGLLNNDAGKILANNKLQLLAGNSALKRKLNNRDGSIQANQLSLAALELNNQGGTIEANKLAITTQADVNNGRSDSGQLGLISALGSAVDSLVLAISGKFNNSAGTLQTNAESLDLAATEIHNSGRIIHAGSGRLVIGSAEKNVQQLNNQGSIKTNGRLELYANNVDNSGGKLISEKGQQLSVTQQLNNNGGLIESLGALNIQAQSLNNQAGEIKALGTANSQAVIAATLDNSGGGKIQSNAASLSLAAASLNNSGGEIEHAGNNKLSLSSNSGGINNDAGSIKTNANLEIKSGTANKQALSNKAGLIVAANLKLLSGQLDNQAGTIEANSADIIVQGDLNNGLGANNKSGIINIIATALDSLKLSVSQLLNNGDGTIKSNSESYSISASAIKNSGLIGHAGSGRLNLKTNGELNNQDGEILSLGTISLGGTSNTGLGSLNNQDGSILAGAALNLNSRGLINNQGGALESKTGFKLTALSLDNSNGRLVSESTGSDAITLSTALVNSAGLLSFKSSLLGLNAANLNNHDGQIILANSNGRLNVNIGRIDNTRSASKSEDFGLIISTGSAYFSAFNQINNSGYIQAGHLEFNNSQGSISNLATGRLIATGPNSLVISAQNFDNNNGTVHSYGALTATIQNLNNQGVFQSHGNAVISLNSLSGEGVISSGQDLDFSYLGGDYTHRSGVVFSAAGKLSINNLGYTFSNEGQINSGGDIIINAKNLNNGSSQTTASSPAVIAASKKLSLNIDETINNYQHAKLSGDGGLQLAATSLSNLGIIASGADAKLKADSINNKNTLFAAGKLDVFTRDSFINNTGANVYALGDVSFYGQDKNSKSTSLLNSSGVIESYAGTVSIKTQLLENTRTEYEVSDQGVVIEDSGAAKILAGKNIRIIGGNIENKISLIAANNNIDLVGVSLLNQSASSGGTGGWSDELLQRGAIELDINGEIQLTAGSGPFVDAIREAMERGEIKNQIFIRKRSLHNVCYQRSTNGGCLEPDYLYSYSLYKITPTQLLEASPTSSHPTTTPSDEDYKNLENGSFQTVTAINSLYTGTSNIVDSSETSLYFPGNNFESRSGAPATIAAGGTLTGSFTGQIDNVNIRQNVSGNNTVVRSEGTAASGSEQIAVTAHNKYAVALKANGTSASTAGQNGLGSSSRSSQLRGVLAGKAFGLSGRESSSTGPSASDRSWVAVNARNNLTLGPNENGAAASIAGQNGTGSQLEAVLAGKPFGLSGPESHRTGPSVSTSSTGPSAVALANNNSSDLGSKSIAGHVGDITLAAYNPVDFLRLPSSPGLFQVNNDPSHYYLVETNPAFSQYTNFIGSNYFLEQMGIQPEQATKRLGDAFYETRLIQDAVFQTTGQRYLAANSSGLRFNNDQDQMRYLMDNGIAAAQRLNLTVGIALSADQVAALTHDTLWLVEQEVQGQKVLVPVYYSPSVRNGDLAVSGALLQGADVQLSAAQLNNDTNINADNSLAIDIEGSLSNQGKLSAANLLSVIAAKISNALGGIIRTDDSGSATLIARSGDINNRGKIQAGDLELIAREGSINNIGSEIKASGDINAEAGNDLLNQNNGRRIATITAGENASLTAIRGSIINNAKVVSSGSGDNQSIRTGIAPIIKAGGNLSLLAGNNIENKAGSLAAGGSLRALAGNNIDISAAKTSIKSQTGNNASEYTQFAINNIKAGAELVLEAGGELNLSGVAATAGGGILLKGKNINITAVENKSHSQVDRGKQKKTTTTIRNAKSSIAANDGLRLVAGNDLNIIGADLKAGGDIALAAGGDTVIESVKDSDYSYSYKKKKKSFGRSKTTEQESYQTTNVASTVQAGGDLLINTVKDSSGQVRIAGDSGNVLVKGSEINAEGNIVVAADGDVSFESSADVLSEFYRKQKRGAFGLKKSDRGHKSLTQLQAEAVSIGGGTTEVNSGGSIQVLASQIISGDDINLTAVDKVEILAEQTLKQIETWNQSSGFFKGGNLYSLSETRENSSEQGTQAAELNAGKAVNINSGSTRVVGSNIDAGTDINISADIGDIEIVAADQSNTSAKKEREISVTMGAFLKSDGIKLEDGQLKISLGEADYRSYKDKAEDQLKNQSNLTALGNVNLNAEDNILVEGSNLIADADGDGAGDANLSAGQDVVIKEATQQHQFESEEVTGSAKTSIVIQHQAVELAKAVRDLAEAGKQLKQAKKSLKEYQREVSKLGDSIARLQTDYDNKIPGVSYQAILDVRQVYQDFKSDEKWYKAGLAAAALNVAQKTILIAQQAQAAATSTVAWGFNAGIQLDIDANKNKQSQQSTSSVASNVGGANVNIQAGKNNSGDSQALIQGSHIQAQKTINISADEVNIIASRDTSISRSENKNGHITAAVTVFGALSGATINASFDRSMSRDSSVTYTNSTVNADEVNINSTGDTTLRGANVHANNALALNVGDDLVVESVQNIKSGNSSNFGVSAGFSLGGEGKADKRGEAGASSKSAVHGLGGTDTNSLSSVSGGIRTGNGRYLEKQTLVTSLTSGGTADINVKDNTLLVGSVVGTLDKDGNDLGLLKLKTKTLDFVDLTDTKTSSNTSISVSTNIGLGGKDNKSNTDALGKQVGQTTLKYSNKNEASASTAMASLGKGDIEIEDKENSSDLDRLNRDIGNTQRDLYSIKGDLKVEVTIDHRVFSQKGREEILGQLESLPANLGAAAIETFKGMIEARDKIVDVKNKIAELLGVRTYGPGDVDVPVVDLEGSVQAQLAELGALNVKTVLEDGVLRVEFDGELKVVRSVEQLDDLVELFKMNAEHDAAFNKHEKDFKTAKQIYKETYQLAADDAAQALSESGVYYGGHDDGGLLSDANLNIINDNGIALKQRKDAYIEKWGVPAPSTLGQLGQILITMGGSTAGWAGDQVVDTAELIIIGELVKGGLTLQEASEVTSATAQSAKAGLYKLIGYAAGNLAELAANDPDMKSALDYLSIAGLMPRQSLKAVKHTVAQATKNSNNAANISNKGSVAKVGNTKAQAANDSGNVVNINTAKQQKNARNADVDVNANNSQATGTDGAVASNADSGSIVAQKGGVSGAGGSQQRGSANGLVDGGGGKQNFVSTTQSGGVVAKYTKVNVSDPAADAIAKRLNGVSSVKFPGKFKDREFDVFSDEFIGQTKPSNFKIGSAFRNQAKATFEAAQELGRKPYFHFDGPPSSSVINKLQEYGKRYGIDPVIDTTPL